MKILTILVACFCIFHILQAQTVDCIKYINSSYANPASCLSSSTSTRPINATGYVKALKNTTWKGIDDWTPFIVRGGYLVVDLFSDEPNCFTA